MTGSDVTPPSVREQLVRGTLKLITDEGPSDLSVRRLAQASDRTTMCIYTKFSSRRGLLDAAYARAADELVERLARAATAAEFAEIYRQVVLDQPGVYEFLFEQPLPALGLPTSVRRDLVGRVIAVLAGTISGPDDQDHHDTARATWATLHGLSLLLRTGADAADALWADAMWRTPEPEWRP